MSRQVISKQRFICDIKGCMSCADSDLPWGKCVYDKMIDGEWVDCEIVNEDIDNAKHCPLCGRDVKESRL